MDEVRERERTALDALLGHKNRRVVLFGAGTLGKRAIKLLKGIDCDILAFSDNSPAACGTEIDGIPVLTPEKAAALYGEKAVFLVTIWNDHHWFRETFSKLSDLGCTHVSTYAPIFWRFPETFLQLYLLNEPPHKLYADSQRVLQAEGIWADDASLGVYRANIRWRALGDAFDLPAWSGTNTYFPSDLFRLSSNERVLDCGAFDGDTIRELLNRIVPNRGAIHAIEADAISSKRLREYVANLESAIRARMRVYQCAVGAQRGIIHFESNGSLTAKVSASGSVVQLYPIDGLFQESRLTFIKMDIEGAEYDALLGARKVIQRDRPILAICVYHTQSDIWRIPLLVKEMAPEYSLYLRAYEGDGFQTVMYAVPPERRL